MFQHNFTERDGSGFGSWKTVPVLRSVPAKTVSDGSGFRFRFGSWATLGKEEQGLQKDDCLFLGGGLVLLLFSDFSANQSTPLFGCPSFCLKHLQENFSLQNGNWHPPKQDWRPPMCQRGCKTCFSPRGLQIVLQIPQISFEPGFGAYQSLAQVLKAPFSRIFSFFLQF